MAAAMERFTETCRAVAETAKKNEKVRLVAEHFRSLPVDDAARAALFFTARVFPRFEERVVAVGGAIIWKAVNRLVQVGGHELEATYRKHGDLGDMTEEALSGAPSPASPASLTLQ